jgi:hypothetical protein
VDCNVEHKVRNSDPMQRATDPYMDISLTVLHLEKHISLPRHNLKIQNTKWKSKKSAINKINEINYCLIKLFLQRSKIWLTMKGILHSEH